MCLYQVRKPLVNIDWKQFTECARCGKPFKTNVEKELKEYGTIGTIEGDAIYLCLECLALFKKSYLNRIVKDWYMNKSIEEQDLILSKWGYKCT